MILIVQKEDPILRAKALKVPVEEIQKENIQSVLKDMKEALKSQLDGVAIAAPQIGKSLRIFIISGRIRNLLKKENTKEYPDEVFINPKIIKLSKKKKKMEEGCLSIRWLYGKVNRAERATVEAYNEHGELFTKGGSELLAQIFQHETDHLDGVLFTDKAEDVEEILPKKTP